MGETRSFFADWTIRHPIVKWRAAAALAIYIISLERKAKLTYPLAFDHPGSITAEAKHGDVSLVRFDEKWGIFSGNAKGN